jgi:hypothetical protein
VPTRDTITRVLLILYALGSLFVVVQLLLDRPGAGELAGTTSGKILAAAIFSMAVGAVIAARDPWGNRTVILMLIVFMGLAALAILWRLLFHHELYAVDPAWLVLPVAVAGPVLLAVFYPRPPQG